MTEWHCIRCGAVLPTLSVRVTRDGTVCRSAALCTRRMELERGPLVDVVEDALKRTVQPATTVAVARTAGLDRRIVGRLLTELQYRGRALCTNGLWQEDAPW